MMDFTQHQTRALLPAGNGNNGRRRSQGGRRKNQPSHGNGNASMRASQLGKEFINQDDMTQFYAFSGKTEMETFDVVIIGTIVVCEWMANVLLDPISTF